MGTSGDFSFEQLLDHDRPWLGRFGQRVWWNAEFWGGGRGRLYVFFSFLFVLIFFPLPFSLHVLSRGEGLGGDFGGGELDCRRRINVVLGRIGVYDTDGPDRLYSSPPEK